MNSPYPVYRIRTDGEKRSVELVEEFELWGNICSVCRVRFAGSPRDAILLSFEGMYNEK